MKIKLSQVVSSQEALKTLSTKLLPAKIAYKIQKNLRLLEPETTQYEKLRSQLIMEKYGEEEVEGSGEFRVPPSNLAEFLKELNELLELEIEADIQKVTLPDTFEISTADIYALSWMINMEEEG